MHNLVDTYAIPFLIGFKWGCIVILAALCVASLAYILLG